MRHASSRLMIAMAVASLCTAGCLSIGGKTYTQESPESQAKISSLEQRVAALESMLHGPATVEQIPSPNDAMRR